MSEYSMPPWVGRPADPAAHYQAGFQIGVHLGAQQAAQQFQAQQLAQQQQRMALAQQQQEFENQYQAQVLSLKAGEMARQHQAAQMYSQMVGSGMDPSRALMQLAPELGESPAAILRNQALRDQAQANMALRRQGMQFQQAKENRIASQGQERLDQGERRIADLEEWRKKQLAGQQETRQRMSVKDRALAMAKVQKELDDSGLISDSKVARRALEEIDSQRWWSDANKAAAKSKAQAHLTEVEGQLSKLRRELMDQYGVELPGPAGAGSVGNNTMPDKPIRKRWTGTEFVPVQ